MQEQRWVGGIESARVHASSRGQSTPSIQAELAAGTDIPSLNLVVGSGVAWEQCNDPPNGGDGCCSEWDK